MPVVKKQRLSVIPLIIPLLSLIQYFPLAAWPTNQRNDPFTVYTSVDPQYFLYEREKQLMFGMPDDKGTPERLMISFSPFGQNANSAKTISATYCPIPVTDIMGTCNQCNNPVYNANPSASTICANEVFIGDIDGRWNLLGFLPVVFHKELILPQSHFGKLRLVLSFPPKHRAELLNKIF